MASWKVSIGLMSIDVEAGNWLSALGVALPQVGMEPGQLGRLVCAMRPDGGVNARDPVTDMEVLVEPNPDAPPALQMPISRFASMYDEEDDKPAAVVPPPPSPPGVRAPEVAARPAPPPARVEHAPPLSPPPAEPPPPPRLEPPPPPRAAPPPPPRLEPPPPPHLPAAPTYVDEPATEEEERDEPSVHAMSLSERLEDLFLLCGGISNATSSVAACDAALEIAQQLIPAESGAVLVKDRSGSRLRFIAATGPRSKKLRNTDIPIDAGLAGFATGFNLGLIIDDAGRDVRHYKQVDRSTGYRSKAILAVPVKATEGSMFGCLELLNPATRFTGDDLQVAAAVAQSLAAFLHRATV
jgi:hypothetical protein